MDPRLNATMPFYTRPTNKPLLSAETCEQLGLLTVETDPEESIYVLKSSNLTREQILTNYKYVFEGLGHIGDTTIITDPNVKPVGIALII